MNRTLIVGYDGSAGAEAALAWALELAERRHSPVRLVRAFEPSMYEIGLAGGYVAADAHELQDAAQHQVITARDRARERHPGLEIEAAVALGYPQRLLVELSHHADTVVLGSSGHSGFHTLLAGSATMHVATHAACPVVAVPSGALAVRETTAGVVVGVDGSRISEAAIDYAFDYASLNRLPLTAVHAWHDPTQDGLLAGTVHIGADPETHAAAQEVLLAESLAGWSEKFPDVQVTRQVVQALPAKALVATAVGAALLVVGCRGRGTLTRLMLGSVSHGVLHLATCPVAVVHAHDEHRSH